MNHQDDSMSSHFILFEFIKIPRSRKSEREWAKLLSKGIILKPCEYKRRWCVYGIWIRRQLNYLHVWDGPCWEVLRLLAMYGSWSLSCTPWTRRTVATFLSFDFLPWLTPSTLFRIRSSMKNFRNSGKLQQRPKSFERYINHSEMGWSWQSTTF